MVLKRIITLSALFLLIFHFTLTLLYNSPIQAPYLNKYMIPLFDQNWRFFAPEPAIESRSLFFRYRSKKNKNWSNWINPGKVSHNKFDYNRLSYHGKLVHLNAAICHYLNAEIQNIKYREDYKKLSNTEQLNLFNKEIVKVGSLDLTKNYLKNWTLWKFDYEVEELQIILSVKDTKSGNINSVLFPTLIL